MIIIMKLKELLSYASLKAAGQQVGLDVQVIEGHLELTPVNPDDPRYSTDFIFPSMRMVEACRADDYDFFYPFLSSGRLTAEQMNYAAERYHLGKTKSGQPLFWMIDEMLDPLDAHIGSGGWISTLLKVREPLIRYWRPTHCLFGLHLLSEDKPICIVESEQSAVVLSELFPDYLWMAYAVLPFLNTALFAPLQGRTVTIYPRANTDISYYLSFEEFAETVSHSYNIHITVDPILENHTTEEQKSRCIDLVDFLIEA